MNNTTEAKSVAIESIISSSIQIPGVKVSRNKFLAETFADQAYSIEDIIANGPIEVGVTREELQRLATKLIFKRTSQSSLASFTAGIPGGLAIFATVPSDVLQFFGMALRLAQEISYLYGAEDLWQNGQVDEEKVRNQLILYCGVMFGVSGAVSGVRVLTAQLAKTALKRLPQKALTKTFWYPIIKKIASFLTIKVTKQTFANGVSKVIPFVGGVISGTLNFVSMMPMANRLQATFDKSCFAYTEAELEEDMAVLESCGEETNEKAPLKERFTATMKRSASGVTNWVQKRKEQFGSKKESETPISQDEVIETIKRLKDLLDAGILTQEEFDAKKSELLEKI